MKKILYLDLDGVCANFSKRYQEIDSHTVLGEHLLEGESELCLQKRQDKVNKVVSSDTNFFQSLELIDGAYESVIKLNDYFDIYFLSTPMNEVPHSFTGKREWIDKIFPKEIGSKKLILTHRKDLNLGDFLVDDRTKNGAGEFKGELILFGSEKFKNWETVVSYLMERK